MKLSILPNWCKWLALALFISSFIIDFSGFKEGYHIGYNERKMMKENPEIQKLSISDLVKSSDSPRIGDLLILLSIIVYVLSKDRRDDEFINSIRAQALLAAFLIVSLIGMIVQLCSGQLDVFFVLTIQFLSYIIIFKILKIRANVVYPSIAEKTNEELN